VIGHPFIIDILKMDKGQQVIDVRSFYILNYMQ